MKKTVIPILIATVWISISEFIRNQYLLQSFWSNHYQNMGLTFPSAPINGAIWGIWSLVFGVIIFILSTKFNLFQTTLLSWIIGFVMMWLVIGNLGVLPWGILPIAIPLSILESFIASYLISLFNKK